ncbi:acyltransferase [Helicobacter kayseriensis]|uniref:acyltransferase n=1 Tax=Helicobacter kayseriensis TaxID=2905877 RepID=UPI001E4F4EC3|nr:acyltransferase [Helicobacter kayseriensis]MCE3046673.1 acyltransferase [Helicobacter kayseriensis]MCE3048025.1 acyltransferase [Helicobacter kayseriensis]
MNHLMQSQYNEGFYSYEELQKIGFASVGKNVLLSRLARIYGASKISIGNNVRIDDFVILSGKIKIGNFVHIGAFSSITGGDSGVTIGDFCGMSSHVKVLAISDDYSGETLTNPCIPNQYKNITKKQIIIEKHCIVGCGSTILPNAFLSEGSSIGAMSLIVRKTKPWGVYFGIPAKRIKERKKDLLKLEKEFLSSIKETMGGGIN